MSSFRYSYALVIGIDSYSNGIPHLKTAVNDAVEITKVLKTEHNYTVIQLLNEEATREQIQHVLEIDLPAQIQPDDRFLFYFAGHGIALNGDDGPEGYLIPQDASFGNVSTYLPMSQVHNALLQLSCRHLLGVLDCCFAGAFRWSSTRKLIPVELGTIHKERFDRFIQDPAWQVITSASYDQTASDGFDLKDDRGQKGGHSPFAAAVIEALQGKADAYPSAELGKPAGDGVITATELYLYLRERLEVETEARFLRQTPGIYPLKKHDKGEYIFLAPGHPLNLPPAPPLDASSNPYRGLESFDEANQDLFFGRQALTQQLAQFVQDHSLTIVLGASGSGKSSLVKAGIIPHLRQVEQWYILPPFRPGEYPLKALNQVLESLSLSTVTTYEGAPLTQNLSQWFEKHPQTHLLLIVDQLEELITLCQDDQERHQFLKLLAQAIALHSNQLHLVLTLRSDFEPQFRNTPLEDNWLHARFIVPPMTREELRQAIEEPASARVMYFDSHELVDQLIDEVANMPGALPLLSFALSELYLNYLKRQKLAKLQGETLDRAMTQADYEELGGVTRSLTQRAEQEYDALVQEEAAYEQTIRNVMLRMVSVGGELARRRVPLSELVYPEPENGRVQTVLKHFESARLFTSGIDSEGQPYQEPAHDALVRGWKRLLDWKQEHLATLILQRELTSDVGQWKNSSQKKRDTGLLWIEDPRLPTTLQLSCGKSYKDNWFNLLQWRLRYQRWRSQPQDYWFNQLESDFIWQSFDQKFKRFGRTSLTLIGVVTALSLSTISALQRAKIAQLREQSAQVLNLMPTANAVSGLILAIDTMDQSLSVPEVEITAQNSLLNAIQVSQEVNRFQGHEDVVWSVAFSSDGQFIASGSEDHTVRLWNAKTGQQIGQPLQGHKSAVRSIAISPDNQFIVSGSGYPGFGESDNTLRLWNAKTGKPVGQPLQGHKDAIYSVVFSPNGSRIVSGSADSTIQLWDVRTRRAIGQPQQAKGLVSSVAFSPNGQRLISGGDTTLQLWDVKTSKPIGQPWQHGNRVYSVSFSPDSKHIVSSGRAGTIRLWDAKTGKPIEQLLEGHESDVNSVAFSPDGSRIVSGSRDNTVRLWDVKTGQQIGQPLQGHGVPVTSVAFSPDGHYVVSGGYDKTIRLWDTEMEQPIGQIVGQPLQDDRNLVKSVAFSSDGQHIVTVNQDSLVQLWDAKSRKAVGRQLQDHGSDVDYAEFSPNGRFIVTVGRDTLWLWDTKTGQSIGEPLQSHEGAITPVAFSPDSNRIISGGEDNTLRLWDIKTGNLIGHPFKGHKDAVISVAFSPDGQRIISASRDDSVLLWDAGTGKLMGHPLQGDGGVVVSVEFSPDGQQIVSNRSDNTVWRWDAKTGRPIGQPLQHEDEVWAIAFSTDGQRIVTGSLDKMLRLWDAKTGQLIGQPLQGHEHGVTSVEFSPDGTRIASGSADTTVRLWDAKTGQSIGQPLQGHKEGITSVAFSPDGQHIVSTSNDTTMRLWDVSPEGWITIACNRLQYHPLLNQPETVTADPEFIKIAHRARRVCQRQVWQHSTNSSKGPMSWIEDIMYNISAIFGG